jgi:hypothetical protein
MEQNNQGNNLSGGDPMQVADELSASMQSEKQREAERLKQLIKDAEDKIPQPIVPIPPPAAIGPSMKTFCPFIKVREAPEDVLRAILALKKRDTNYMQCQGTTTLFGDKKCHHRRCLCITRNAARTFVLDPSIFSKEEMVTLTDAAKKEYSICHRHSLKLRVPFDYLKLLQLEVSKMETEIRGGVVMIRKNMIGKDPAMHTLLDLILDLVPQLGRISRQEAADARSSIKRGLDEFLRSETNETNRPQKLLKLNTVYDMLVAQIDGSDEDHANTSLERYRSEGDNL